MTWYACVMVFCWQSTLRSRPKGEKVARRGQPAVLHPEAMRQKVRAGDRCTYDWLCMHTPNVCRKAHTRTSHACREGGDEYEQHTPLLGLGQRLVLLELFPPLDLLKAAVADAVVGHRVDLLRDLALGIVLKRE